MEHHVYFWLKQERQNTGDRMAFEQALDSLLEIEVADGNWSVPADTEKRAVTDHSWDYGLSIRFATLAEHDVYQVHAEHDVFVAGYKSWWEKVLVMDMK